MNKHEFEIALLEAHKENLKDASDAESFTKHVLDSMYNSDLDTYLDEDGDECRYEIPANETHHGRSVWVS